MSVRISNDWIFFLHLILTLIRNGLTHKHKMWKIKLRIVMQNHIHVRPVYICFFCSSKTLVLCSAYKNHHPTQSVSIDADVPSHSIICTLMFLLVDRYSTCLVCSAHFEWIEIKNEAQGLFKSIQIVLTSKLRLRDQIWVSKTWKYEFPLN